MRFEEAERAANERAVAEGRPMYVVGDASGSGYYSYAVAAEPGDFFVHMTITPEQAEQNMAAISVGKPPSAQPVRKKFKGIDI